MPLRFTDISAIDPSFTPKGVQDKIRGGALANQGSRDAALQSQLQVLPRGRRILARAGIQGQDETLVADGADPDSVAQVYPEPDAERVLARARCYLTPGYVVASRVLTLPTGPANSLAGGGAWVEGVAAGSIRVDLSLKKGVGTLTASTTFTPSWSTEPDKALPSGAGAAWGVVEDLGTKYLIPPEQAAVVGWVEGVEAEVTIVAIGGARPLDVCVYEAPGGDALHDESHRECTISNFPLAPATAGPYALTAVFQPTNGIKGSQQANKTLADQRQVHGPMLASWSCWNERLALVTASEGTAIQITQTSFRDLHSTSITGYAASNPGWSVSSGAYARNLEQSGSLELRGVNGCIPVTVRVWARMLNAAHVGTVRFQSEAYSLRDITVTGSTVFQWYSGLAWLRTPVHASLDSVLQVLGKVNAGGQTLEIRYASVEYGGHHEVTE